MKTSDFLMIFWMVVWGVVLGNAISGHLNLGFDNLSSAERFQIFWEGFSVIYFIMLLPFIGSLFVGAYRITQGHQEGTKRVYLSLGLIMVLTLGVGIGSSSIQKNLLHLSGFKDGDAVYQHMDNLNDYFKTLKGSSK